MLFGDYGDDDADENRREGQEDEQVRKPAGDKAERPHQVHLLLVLALPFSGNAAETHQPTDEFSED